MLKWVGWVLYISDDAFYQREKRVFIVKRYHVSTYGVLFFINAVIGNNAIVARQCRQTARADAASGCRFGSLQNIVER